MSTGRMVDVETLCGRLLHLFTDLHNAWGHLRDHALGGRHPGEERGWGLLLPALELELAAGGLEDLRDLARTTRADAPAARLEPIYNEFLAHLQRTIEKAVALNWYWETIPGRDGRWTTFGHDGVCAHLDEDFVRTGYLPESDPAAWAAPPAVNPRYRLFLACLNRLQVKYNRAVRSGQIETVHPALEQILGSGLSETDWNAHA